MKRKLFIILVVSALMITDLDITTMASEQQKVEEEQDASYEDNNVDIKLENTEIENLNEGVDEIQDSVSNVYNTKDIEEEPEEVLIPQETEESKNESSDKKIESLATYIPKVTFSMNQNCSMYLYDYKEIPIYTYINGTRVTFSNDGEAKFGDYKISSLFVDVSCNESVADVFGYSSDSYSNEQPHIAIATEGKVSRIPISVNISYMVAVPEYDPVLDYTYDNYYEYNYKTTMNLKTNRYKKMWARAWISDYNTRSNVFYMKVQNLSSKTITVYSSSAKAFDCDYKKFDRKLKLTKNKKKISIKPGKTVTVKFKVKGKVTWYDYDDFEICSYWKWGKKKYWVSVQNGYSPYRRSGKKWKVCGVGE